MCESNTYVFQLDALHLDVLQVSNLLSSSQTSSKSNINNSPETTNYITFWILLWNQLGFHCYPMKYDMKKGNDGNQHRNNILQHQSL